MEMDQNAFRVLQIVVWDNVIEMAFVIAVKTDTMEYGALLSDIYLDETSFMQTDVISNGVYSYAYNREHFHDDDFGEIVGQYYLTLISDGTSSTQTDLEHL
ncbi:hypothetical protein MAR_035579 [Mya arenaria]|uniref:Uncharacterized protein n=1 Tax=Mya arenaria TaxID=6604 RepID=A0ABY7EKI9_MYAAR|nr:hypothetical protein MAR_035579 [Mya arenaria]